MYLLFFFFNDTATTEIYTLSLHDALPICIQGRGWPRSSRPIIFYLFRHHLIQERFSDKRPQLCECPGSGRSEEHTSELQSRQYLVCRLLLEKKKNLLYNTTLL